MTYASAMPYSDGMPYSGTVYYNGSPVVPASYQQNGGSLSPNPVDGNRRPEELRPPQEASGPAPASILVRLPADAKLTIDDNPTQSTSGERRFVSPPLQPGKEFRYVLKASIVRGGETITATQNVMVRAGKESEVTLEFPGAKARGD
jgi:uncharacterized protein (TIGR03000 family)